MPIKWKQRFKPEVLLNKIGAIRTVNSEGGISFDSFQLHEYLPALHSMLDFPPISAEVDTSNFVWYGLSKIRGSITAESFLKAVNAELTEQLARRDQHYVLLTSISLNPDQLPKEITSTNGVIKVHGSVYPKRFNSRKAFLRTHPATNITPDFYCKLSVRVKAKSPHAAANKALKLLDSHRALWNLICNPTMQITLGSSGHKPINVIRLGGEHTLHNESGELACETLWYEPNFTPISPYRFSDPNHVKKLSRHLHRKLLTSNYERFVTSALIRYVRALDEGDLTSAFIRLWGALESLICPGLAEYQKLVQRCAYLFKDHEYHKQQLEHLREYRNATVHSGVESDQAQMNCYQLQLYFRQLIWFLIRNGKFFKSIDEANAFLDSPADAGLINREIELLRKAVRFIS